MEYMHKAVTEEEMPSVGFLQHVAKLDKPTNTTSQLPFNSNNECLMIYSIICHEAGCRIFTLYILRYKLHEITLIIQIQAPKGVFSSKILLRVVGSKSFRLDEPFNSNKLYTGLPMPASMSCHGLLQSKTRALSCQQLEMEKWVSNFSKLNETTFSCKLQDNELATKHIWMTEEETNPKKCKNLNGQ